jgi:hypothetical protein
MVLHFEPSDARKFLRAGEQHGMFLETLRQASSALSAASEDDPAGAVDRVTALSHLLRPVRADMDRLGLAYVSSLKDEKLAGIVSKHSKDEINQAREVLYLEIPKAKLLSDEFQARLSELIEEQSVQKPAVETEQATSAETDVEREANYEGSWAEAQAERMKSPDWLARYATLVHLGANHLSDTKEPGDRLRLDSRFTRQEYLNTIDQFNDRLDYLKTKGLNSVDSSLVPLKPTDLGRGVFDPETPAAIILADGLDRDTGEPITPRLQDLVVAHESYHALVHVVGPEAAELVHKGFDLSGIRNDVATENERRRAAGQPPEAKLRAEYLTNPDEIMARMAQLKNYFGMKGDESFTREHLDYAKAHYLEDVGLDNNMTIFFANIKPDEFVALMNELPV